MLLQDFPDHNRTRIGRIKFLTYFSSEMLDKQLELGKIEKSPRKPIFGLLLNWRLDYVPTTFNCEGALKSLLALHIGPYRGVLMTPGQPPEKSPGRSWDIISPIWVENLVYTTLLSVLNGQTVQRVFIWSRKKVDHANQLLTIR